MRKYKLVDTSYRLEAPEANPVVITRTPSPLDEFQTEVLKTGKDEEVLFITSDIAVFFNQQRLMNLNPAVIQELTQNMKRQKPNMKLSDEQLFGALKSRYIQSNADIYAWSRSIQADLDSTISPIEAEAAAQAAKTAEPAAGNGLSERFLILFVVLSVVGLSVGRAFILKMYFYGFF